MAGWMDCDFTSFLSVFQSYQDDGWVIMKDCVSRIRSESELFTGDTSRDNHTPGSVIRVASP